MRNVLSKEVVEKIRSYILCSVTSLMIVPVYEIMWENNIELGRPHMIV
jgi:hypothetical protein